MIGVLDDFLREVGEQPDAAAVRRTCQERVEALGFERFAFTSLNVPELDGKNYFLCNYPPEYMVRYIRHQYRTVDPVLDRTKTEILPFDWDISKLRGRDRRQQGFLSAAADFDITKGITVPVHNPGMQYASLHAVAGHAQPAADLAAPRVREELVLIAVCMNAVVGRRLLPRQADSPAVNLTAREKECLLWTARGKTAWDISQILGISESTAVAHIKHAMAKLEVYNRPHAVVKAIMLGLVIP